MEKTSNGRAVVTLPAANQIQMTREFNAPRELVWKACTTPELIKRWWGGKRGTVTDVSLDLRVGGAWRFVMVANGGFEVAFHGVYEEIESAVRTVNTEVFEGIPNGDDNPSVVTTTYADAGAGRTTMTVLIAYDSEQTRDFVLSTGMEDGAQESYDALEEVARDLFAR